MQAKNNQTEIQKQLLSSKSNSRTERMTSLKSKLQLRITYLLTYFGNYRFSIKCCNSQIDSSLIDVLSKIGMTFSRFSLIIMFIRYACSL